MPYVSDDNLDESQENKSGQTQQAAGQVSGQPDLVSGATGTQSKIQNQNSATEAPAAPSLASGSGVTGSSGGGSGAGSFNAAAPTSSGQWTNLQNYLDANNGGQFGTDFAGNVGKDVTGAQSSINDATSKFQGAVDSNTVNTDQNLTGQVQTAPEKLTGDQQAAFEKELNGSYAGPKNAENDPNFQSAHSQAQTAYDETNQAQNPGGQQALLEKFYNTPNYTSGEKSLDTAILSSDPNAQAAIGALAKQASGLPVNYQAATQGANTAANAGAATTAKTRADARAALGIDDAGNIVDSGIVNGQPNAVDKYGYSQNPGAIDAFLRSLDSKVDALKSQDTTPSSLSGLGLTSDQLGGSFMIDPITGKQIDIGGAGQGYNVDAFGSKYFTPGDSSNLNRGNVANSDDVARLNALSQLAGLKSPLISNIDEAGTMSNGSPYKFNSGDYLKDRSAAQKAYQDAAYQAGLKAHTDYMAAPSIPDIYGPDSGQYEKEFQDSLAALKKQYRIT